MKPFEHGGSRLQSPRDSQTVRLTVILGELKGSQFQTLFGGGGEQEGGQVLQGPYLKQAC